MLVRFVDADSNPIAYAPKAPAFTQTDILPQVGHKVMTAEGLLTVASLIWRESPGGRPGLMVDVVLSRGK